MKEKERKKNLANAQFSSSLIGGQSSASSASAERREKELSGRELKEKRKEKKT